MNFNPRQICSACGSIGYAVRKRIGTLGIVLVVLLFPWSLIWATRASVDLRHKG